MWTSQVYPPFRQGDALTPLALEALLALPQRAPHQATIDRGLEYLAGLAPADPEGDAAWSSLSYPSYVAAGAVAVLSAPRLDESRRAARNRWLAFLRRQQLNETWGWQPHDPQFGGWSYALAPPRKPREGQPASPLAEPNLSATLFALRALHTAGYSADDPAVRNGLTFVDSLQNFAADDSVRDSRFDDGGFYFIHGDPVRNKAGILGQDQAGRTRYGSYGSTTADGLLAMLYAGQRSDSPRLTAAAQWLSRNFAADEHPGNYRPDRRSEQPAVYYYYARATAEAFQLLSAMPQSWAQPPSHWSEKLADALIARQRSDGSWRNDAVSVREDDPLVATPLAMIALCICRSHLHEQRPITPPPP
jgi:squalene-hopene/tetraprenyl-beta-curcumene cyclase